MTSDQRDAVFSIESPDLEEGGAGDGGGGDSDTDEDLHDAAIPETNEDPEDDDPDEEDPTTAAVVASSSTDAVTVALPAGSAVPVSVIPVDSDPKWHRTTEIVHHHHHNSQRMLPPPIDDSRRLFQRLWTDEDEIELLRGFLDYVTSHRGSNSSHPPDTAPFYELIKSKLQLEFNKNQLVEKLRRLKKKYRNVMSKISSGKEVFFKSPHDQSTFEISRKIWNQTGKIIGFEDNNVMDFEETNANTTNGNYFNSPGGSNPIEVDSENGVERRLTMSSGSRKRSRSRIGKIEEDSKPVIDGNIPNTAAAASNVNLNEPATAVIGGNIGVLIEETVKSCVSPLIKEMMNGTTSMMMAAMGGGGGVGGGHGHGFGSLSPMFTRPLGYGVEGGGGNKAVNDERWRKQQILELEVYSRRLELVQEQIRATLHELKTMPSGV